MLSSLGFESKNHARNGRNGASKYFEVPRGFSVHVFKNPATASSHTYTPAGGKPNPVHGRPVVRSKPPAYPPRPDNERKNSLIHPSPPADYDAAFVLNRSKPRKNYGIYPSATDNNTYIYERSVSSASDILASSHSSSSSDSDDSISGSAVSTEVSSTRASSSTETLETTALSVRAHVSNAVGAAPSAPLRATPSSGSAGATPDNNGTIPRVPLIVSEETSPRFAALPPTFAVPIHLATVETVSDSDSDTVIDDPIVDITRPRRANAGGRDEGRRDFSVVPSAAALSARRDTDGHSSSQQVSRSRDSPETQQVTTSTALAPAAKCRYEDSSSLRAPPGLAVTTAYDGGDQLRRVAAGSSSHPTSNSSDVRPPQRPPAIPLPVANRTGGISESAPAVLTRIGEGTPHNNRDSPSRTVERDARAESTIPLARATSAFEGGFGTTSRRCVRWTENLVCPSPVPPSERRKGWFNRRGDQLWTNDGRYKSVEAGKDYPPDLVGYPEPNSGWMNENGVRIDMQHHLIPKPPLRSALKRPKASPTQ
ncbi:hypothetical protein SCP_1502510 [Sparassis crispa]|uniref:Uncharacterized protein n=1 Tax=Sparassis crispa TaxID=139825 RepID=A0A401H4B2_9APHY|nr:hypothetical protein SCP_1502510 [Sparassis crispa]GBE89243.1 hypothetical protein SCP_1502510 [Sparassis crispa]